MLYNKESKEWLLIRANAGHFFSPETMRFFGSKIYWNSLTPVGDRWFFITSEDNFDRSLKLFSLREVDESFNFNTVDYQEFETLAEAKEELEDTKKWVNS